MEEQFVTYEIALKLKELGFDEPCFAVWYKSSSNGYTIQLNPLKLDDIYNIEPLASFQRKVSSFDLMDAIIEYNFNEDFNEVDGEGNEFDPVYSAPLYQQLFDWFMRTHKIHISIPCYYDGWSIDVRNFKNDTCYRSKYGYVYENYQEAREQAILKSIELCKKN